jgi:helicase MOV-10
MNFIFLFLNNTFMFSDVSLLERYMKHTEVYKRRDTASSPDEVHDDRVITKLVHKDEVYDDRVITKLVHNYRSHPAILKVPNELFYNNELIASADKLLRESLCQWSELPKKGFPVMFHGVMGQDQREERSPSFFNPEEVAITLQYVDKLLDMKPKLVKQNHIGVISPYHKQVQNDTKAPCRLYVHSYKF